TTFGAQTNAINYSFLYYTRTTEATVRPFISAGAGVKSFRGTGTEQPFQPLSKFALLSKTQDTSAMVAIGIGVTVKIASHAQLRFDVHDYMSPFPDQVIVPNVGSSVGGWVHDIVPMVGISFTN